MSNRYFSILLAGCLSALMICAAAVQAADSTERETRSTSGFVTERGSEPRRDALSLEPNSAPSRIRKPAKGSAVKSAQTQAAACCAFYIYSADAELFDDFDDDGYYTYLRVVFDVDTDFFDADVYADVYLAPIGEPWELIYESEVFTIFGSSPDDDYEVETEFVSGYPPGDYDVLIDVFDAETGDLVDTVGPEDFPSLGYLPIEDISYDTDVEARVFISSGGGGSLSVVGLAMLAGLAFTRARARIIEI